MENLVDILVTFFSDAIVMTSLKWNF